MLAVFYHFIISLYGDYRCSRWLGPQRFFLRHQPNRGTIPFHHILLLYISAQSNIRVKVWCEREGVCIELQMEFIGTSSIAVDRQDQHSLSQQQPHDCVHAQFSASNPDSVSLCVFASGGKRLTLARNRTEPIKQALSRLKIKLGLPATDAVFVVKKLSRDCQHADAPIDTTTDMEALPDTVTIEEAFVESNFLQIGADSFLPIFVNMPCVQSLSFGQYPLVGVPIIPSCVCEHTSAGDEDNLWRWLRVNPAAQTHPQELEVVSDERVYTPTEADYGCSLYVECTPRCRQPHLDDTYRVGDTVRFHLVDTTAQSEASNNKQKSKQKKDKKAPSVATSTAQTPTPTSTPDITSQSEDTSSTEVIQTRVHTILSPHIVSKYDLHPALRTRCEHMQPPANKNTFRVCTYNILLDAFCDNEWALKNIYPHLLTSPQERLYANIDIRKQAVVMELLHYRADIVCLQEMSGTLIGDYFKSQFERDPLNYECLYANKVSIQPFGCAVCFNKHRFAVVESLNLDLTQCWNLYQDKNAAICEQLLRFPDMQASFERTTTTALCVLLEDKHVTDADDKKRICVVNGHLFSSPQAPHYRVLQSALIMNYVESVYGNECPLIICSDLNATSDSGAFEYLVNGQLSRFHDEWAEGRIFTTLTTETQADRQDTWHNVMTEEDITFARRSFAGLCKQYCPLSSLQQPKTTMRLGWRMLEAIIAKHALAPTSATIKGECQQFDEESSLSYSDYFGWLALQKQRQRSVYDEVIVPSLTTQCETLNDTASSACIDSSSNAHDDKTSQYAALDLSHSHQLLPSCLDTEITHYAGQQLHGSRLDNIFYDGTAFQLSSGDQPEKVPKEVLLTETRGIPNAQFPSDHVSLLVDLEWKQR
jgi:mRNA deadenylase 3'-5' endonuclease subunit Ccr4